MEPNIERHTFEVTIPVLNEEKTLEKNVLIALDFIKSHVTPHFKIVIADNGSTDKTEEIAINLCKITDEIKYLKLPKKGVGLALRTSWFQSEADIVGYMDLDLSTDLTHLRDVFELLQDGRYEIINGSRLLKGSLVKNRSITREITSRCFNHLIKRLLGVKLSDGMCGFKFFKRSTVQKLINTGIMTEGWFFSAELLVKAIWSGIAVKEIPVNWSDDSQSKVDIPTLAKQYLIEIFRLKKEKKNFIKNNDFSGSYKSI